MLCTKENCPFYYKDRDEKDGKCLRGEFPPCTESEYRILKECSICGKLHTDANEICDDCYDEIFWHAL